MVATRKDLDAIFEMDEAKETGGVVIAFGKLHVTIARAGGSNKEFAKVYEELTRPFKRLIENGIDLDEEVAQDILHETFARTVVKGWNLVGDDKEPVPADTENVVAEFKRRPEFFRFVFAEAQRTANYRKAVLKEEAKN